MRDTLSPPTPTDRYASGVTEDSRNGGSQTERKLPNFFIVGAPKAGTTSLYHYLDQHPQIYMSPVKETFYFAEEMRPQHCAVELQQQTIRQVEETQAYLRGPMLKKRFAGIVEDWDDYCRLFAGVREETAIGEATPMYLWSKTAPQRIAERVPEAKIVMILRDPADRAFSQYVQTVKGGEYRATLRQQFAASLAALESDEISYAHPFLEYGLYAEQLERYRQAFPTQQIGIWLYEDIRGPNFLREVYEFLGVDGGFVADTTQRHLEQRVPRVQGLNRLMRKWYSSGLRHRIPARVRKLLGAAVFHPRSSVKMTSEERRMLIEFYREDVLRLQAMIGKDLSAWLQ